MCDPYEPPSDFLRAIVAGEVPLSGTPLADENMRQLIEMMSSDDPANRDWATMLLAQEEADTPEIREALLKAARDENDVVRAEALLGIAKRDTQLALPLAMAALSGTEASMAVLEAAEIIAHPELVVHLRPWTEPSDNRWLDQLAMDAMKACEGKPSGK